MEPRFVFVCKFYNCNFQTIELDLLFYSGIGTIFFFWLHHDSRVGKFFSKTPCPPTYLMVAPLGTTSCDCYPFVRAYSTSKSKCLIIYVLKPETEFQRVLGFVAF